MKTTPTDQLAGNAAQGEATFSLLQPDSFFVPYGSYRHKLGLQVFDQAAANQMVAAHNSALSKLTRWLTGVSYPVYVGHPDIPGSKDLDKKAYGWIETMVAENEGLRLGVKWSPEGRALVDNAAYKFYSPTWWLRGDSRKQTPAVFQSMGLTNQPNIPVPALANDAANAESSGNDLSLTNESTTPTEMNPEILAALGLAATATAEEALAAIHALQKDAAEEESPEPPAVEATENEAGNTATCGGGTKAANDVDAATGRLTVFASAAIQRAVSSGRLAPSEVESKTAELLASNDLASALAALDAMPQKIKTESVTGDLGSAKTQLVIAANDAGKVARDARKVAVDGEFAATHPSMPDAQRRRIAFTRAAAKNPELFSNKSPGATA